MSYQRWGFSRFSLAKGFKTFFKGGWRGTSRGSLVHEAALFERGPLRISMAVLTDGNPSHGYGTATLRGVAQRIFGGSAKAAVAVLDGDSRAREPAAPGELDLRGAGLVDVHRHGPGIKSSWPTGRATTSQGGACRATANWALLRERAARDLGRVQRRLRRRGLGLLVLDAYRPARASSALVRWARDSGRSYLVGTYIAQRSRHNTGTAVDLTLVRLADGRRLDMGSAYDDLAPARIPPTPPAARCATAWCSSGRWNASATAATGVSGGTSSTKSSRAGTSTCRSGAASQPPTASFRSPPNVR